jgi:hypothetical protein
MQIKQVTKGLIGLMIGASTLLQDSQVRAQLLSLVASHPRYTGAISLIVGVLVLLHNPQVQQELGIKKTVVSEEVVPLDSSTSSPAPKA